MEKKQQKTYPVGLIFSTEYVIALHKNQFTCKMLFSFCTIFGGTKSGQNVQNSGLSESSTIVKSSDTTISEIASILGAPDKKG